MSPIKIHNADYQNLKTLKTIFISLLVLCFHVGHAQQKTINPNRYIGSKKQDKILKTEFWNPAYEIADVTVDSVVRYVDSVNDRVSVAYVSVNKWLRGSGPIVIKIPVSNTEDIFRSKNGQLITIVCKQPEYLINLFQGRNIVSISNVKGDYSLVSFISIPANNQNPSSKYDRITFSKYKNYGNLVKEITWPSEVELFKYINSKLGNGKHPNQNSKAQKDTINTYRYIGSIEQNKALETEFWNPAYLIADINVDSVSRFVDSADRNHAIAFVTVNKWLRGSGPDKISIPIAGREGRYKRLDGSIKWIKCARTMYREKKIYGRNIVALSKVNGIFKYISFFRIPDYNQMPQSKYDRITFSKYYDYGNLVKNITWPSEEELFKYINSKLSKGKKSK